MRSNPAHQLFFIFQLENILRSYFYFSTSYGRSIDLKSLLGSLLVSIIWLGQKISLKYLLIGWVDVFPPHVQTVSTSLMSKLVKKVNDFFYLRSMPKSSTRKRPNESPMDRRILLYFRQFLERKRLRRTDL